VPLLLSALLSFSAISLGWFAFEWLWDRRLFRSGAEGTSENVRAAAARELVEAEGRLQVLDVRSSREYARGRLPRAIQISLGDPAFEERVSGLDRDRPVLVYCAGGFRSRKAVAVLRRLGFQRIHHLHRGYHSWQFAGYPVEKGEPQRPA
jgi:rhodanese-related sulfurtransferase